MKSIYGWYLFCCLILFMSFGYADDTLKPDKANNSDGEVRVPLLNYTRMLEQSRRQPSPAPVSHAIGESRISVQIVEQNQRVSAQIEATVMVETFTSEWTLIPILPVGVALNEVSLDQQPVALVKTEQGLAWSTNQARTVNMHLRYSVDAQRSDNGFVLSLPVPEAVATGLDVVLPGIDLDLSIVPGSDLQFVEQDGITQVSASIPMTSSVLISWRTPGNRSHALSRAHYRGELKANALLWRADYQVEVFTGELITLPLLADTVTLSDIRIDNEPAMILVEEGYFATVLQGRGLHQVSIDFQVPVQQHEGPPQAYLQIPRVPVSQFDLILPGRKELVVEPQANIVTTEYEDRVEARLFMPMTDTLTFSWLDAIPEDMRTEVRSNASLYHSLYAEEGVLHGRADIVYEITHGETNLLEIEIPKNAQVNRIDAPGVSDWSVSASDDADYNLITVFLDREVKNDYVISVSYELLLGSGAQAAEPVAVPLLRAAQVHRQRGMVALLVGPELTLEPVSEDQLSGVGENQLPALVRNQLQQTVAHTYKYIDPAAQLVVKAVAPERQQGIFDAQVDTLISIGEVSLRGSATIEINVKSGSLLALQLQLPNDLNVLGVSAPSLRQHQVQNGDDTARQTIDMEFTREMEGQFRVQVNYERILADSEQETPIPTVSVNDAEVEHGRIAVEALTAVEVQAAVAEQLSLLDINELPQQLVLKTTNPILLAYKYVRTESPFQLALNVTRHQELEVQVAAIETAHYQTLYTRDGLAVTQARLNIRNSRRQFLRLELPADSEIWSVFVDGQSEKPARASDSDSAVLIKMINSANGFPVEIVYASKISAMSAMGTLSNRLPRPDIVVTHTRWDVFLPIAFRYQEPSGTMDSIFSGRRVNPRTEATMTQTDTLQNTGQNTGSQPLRISVPTQGIQFSFEKLYANQSPEAAEFSIAYLSEDIGQAGWVASIIAVVLIWIAIFGLANGRMTRVMVSVCIALGVLLLLASVAYLRTDPVPASIVALAIAVVSAVVFLVRRWLSWRRERLNEEPYEYSN